MPTKFTLRITTIVAITALSLLLVFPPARWFNPALTLGQKTALKPGIDISGGASLLYQIKPPPGAVPNDLSERVMAILKRRVDPDGVRNLIWRPQGPTRLEIQMPAAAKRSESGEARVNYTEARQRIDQLNLSEAEVLSSVRTLADRGRLTTLASDSQKRKDLFDKLVKLQDAMTAARAADDARAAGQASAEFDDLKSQITETNIDTNLLAQYLEKPAALSENLARLKSRLGTFPSAQLAVDSFIAAHKAYEASKDSIDDVAALKRMLRGSGVLEFRILVTDELTSPEAQKMRERLAKWGPSPRPGDTMRWCRVSDEMVREEMERRKQFAPSFQFEKYNDDYWILAYASPVTGSGQTPRAMDKKTPQAWNLTSVSSGRESGSGGWAVYFRFDPQGGVYFGELSGNNINKPLGIVLDNTMISAPNLKSRITDSGQITGNFSQAEVNYLVRTLTAGSLPAQLEEEPLMERSVGPQVGHDNLVRGLWSCVFGVFVVAVFLIGYYRLSGVVAMVAVLMNLALILGAMVLFNASFTLPSIAGVILTIGMAVDANVLIFERFREEQHRGLPLRTALRNAYERAFSAILDSNVTTGITAGILWVLGTEEVKGFGLTLMIGLASSLFTALFVTKTIFGLMLEKGGLKSLSSLPQAWPALDRALRPNINWMGKIRYFVIFSTVLPVLGLVALVYYGRQGKLLDVEFGAGTQVQFELKEPMPQQEVRQLIEDFDATKLPSPSIVTVGDSDKSGRYATYEVITTNTNGKDVKAAIMDALKGKLKVQEASDFTGRDKPIDEVGALVLPVTLDTKFNIGFTPSSARSHVGGVAVVLKNISPPLSPREIRDRLDALRLEPGSPFTSLAQKSLTVDGPGPAGDPTDRAVAFLSDPTLGPEDMESEAWKQAWSRDLAEPFWKLTNEAIHSSPQLERVNQFDASVAADMQMNATIALVLSILVIMAYIWMRFGDMTYATAVVAGLLHDTIFTIAAIGFAHFLAQTALGRALLIEPFRINLTMVAAVLTVMGYSLNDTVVVFDRIRELRGKYGGINPQTLNDAINQTLSRTLLTGGTTLLTIFVMYVWGGSGIHGFTFLLLFGILIGTYSSIAIASPMLLLGGRTREKTARSTATSAQQAG